MTESNNMLEAALQLAEREFYVFPVYEINREGGCSCGNNACSNAGKHPRVSGGLKAASKDPAVIRQWWSLWPNANIGIATGPLSGVFVLDVDAKSGGLDSFAELEKDFETVPNTLRSNTGGGGFHLFFRYPAEGEVRNSSGKVAAGIDVRGDGGYVVAPPSIHKSGTAYAWVDATVAVVEAPSWLTTLCNQKQKKKQPKLTVTPADSDTLTAVPAEDQKLPQLVAIAEGCDWARLCIENAATLSEPPWYAFASVAGNCDNGRQLFHDVSKPYPGYSAEEADKKLDHALASAGPRTCANIAETLFSGCNRCPFSGQITSPIVLGYKPAEIVKLMRDYVFDVETGTYVDLKTGVRLIDKHFSNKHRHLTGDTTPHTELMVSSLTRKVDRVDYIPGDDRLLVPAGPHQTVLNVWRKGQLQAAQGDAPLIFAHLAYLMPDDKDRSDFLDWLAYGIQHPAEKIRRVVLLIGQQGIGKSFLIELLQALVGEQNVRTVESEELLTQWTASLANIQVLVVEELMTFERQEVYDRLKTWITQEFTRVNDKFVKPYSARTPRLILAFSNNQVPIRIQKGDRRFHVIESPASPHAEPDYYTKLFSNDGGLGEAGAFLQFLQDRDVSHFNPSAHPPMTDAKSFIMGRSRPALLQELEIMMDEEVAPFWRDLIELGDVATALSFRLRRNFAGTRPIADALKQMGASQLTQVRLSANRRPRPWAWRNVEGWLKASPEEIRKELERQPSPGAI